MNCLARPIKERELARGVRKLSLLRDIEEQ
jgi:hypothetical protein